LALVREFGHDLTTLVLYEDDDIALDVFAVPSPQAAMDLTVVIQT